MITPERMQSSSHSNLARFEVTRGDFRVTGCEVFSEKEIPNMAYIVPEGMVFDGYLHLLPDDVKLRRRLSGEGLSGLPTVVILPGVKLEKSVLAGAQKFVQEKVAEMGLPDMDQLYIRSRNPRFRSFNSGAKPVFSSRSLIVNGEFVEHVDESSSRGSGKSVIKYDSPEDWQSTLPSNTVYMVHAEDDKLQRMCLHGIVGMTGINQISLAIGDGRVHARALDSRLTIEGSKLKPFLRLKGSEFDRLEFDGGQDKSSACSSVEDAKRLYRRWKRLKRQIIPMYERVVQLCGSGSMMEWRAYPDGQVHVLDVDTGF